MTNKQIIYNYVVVLWLFIITARIIVLKEEMEPPSYNISIITSKGDEFLLNWEVSIPNMLTVCEYYNIKYPRIVTAQAILESDNFKSGLFISHQNPFGLYNSSTQSFFKFDHWTQAVVAYQKLIESKYQEGDYYEFLNDIGYATDPYYIRKVKAIEKLIPYE